MFKPLIITLYAKESLPMSYKNHEELKYNFQQVSPLLIALGDPIRQIIIMELLKQNSCDGIQVNDFVGPTHLSRPAISHHLKILKDVDVIGLKKDGTKNFYYLNPTIPHLSILKKVIDDINSTKTGN